GPAQIRFTRQAVQEIILASDRLRREFWHPDSEIELINSGERTTERIMRLSAAVASRVFSTADGENLFITKEHVQFVEQFLRKQYTKFEFDHYIQSLRTQQRVSAAIRDQQQQKTEEEKAQDKLKAITRTKVVSLLVQNKLFFDTLRSGKYDLMAEKDSERRAAIGWMYNEGYVHSEEGRYFQFTKAFYEELEPELNTTDPLAQPY